MGDFERCRVLVAIAEGGDNFSIVNGKPVLNPKAQYDKGGFTRMGVTWGALSTAYAQGIVDHNDITRLTKNEVLTIFKTNYWHPSRSDKMAWGLCLIHFDCAINCGVFGAAKQLQRALNNLGQQSRGQQLSVDGVIGPLTLAAITEASGVEEAYLKVREAYYRGLVQSTPTQGANLNGWLNRLKRIRKELNINGQ